MQAHVHVGFHLAFCVPTSHHTRTHIATSVSTHTRTHTSIGPSETVRAVPAAEQPVAVPIWVETKPMMGAHTRIVQYDVCRSLHMLPAHTRCRAPMSACSSQQPADSLLTYRLTRPLYSDGPRPRRAGPAPCLCPPRPGLALNLSRLASTDGTPVRVLEVLRAAMAHSRV